MADQTDDQAGADAGEGEEPTPGDDGRFDAAYVATLRQEAAERRVAARTAEETATAATARLEARSARLLELEVAEATRGVLADPTDLLAHVDADQLSDEDGEPSAEKIRAAATELVGRKAHLAPRPVANGGIDQGARDPVPEAFDFAAALRSAAG